MGKVAVGASVVCAAAVCVAAAVVVRQRMQNTSKWSKVMGIMKEFEEECGTQIGKLRQLADAMTVEMHAGLASEGGSKLKMLISFVDNLPTGSLPFSFPVRFVLVSVLDLFLISLFIILCEK